MNLSLFLYHSCFIIAPDWKALREENSCELKTRKSCYNIFLLFVSGNNKFPLCCKLKNTSRLFSTFHFSPSANKQANESACRMLHNYDNNKVTSHLRIGRTISLWKEIENLDGNVLKVGCLGLSSSKGVWVKNINFLSMQKYGNTTILFNQGSWNPNIKIRCLSKQFVMLES